MRLKEPLQSMKTLNGHIVMHATLFIVSFNIDIHNYVNAPADPRESEGGLLPQDNRETNELLVFRCVQWGHCICALFLMLSFILKGRQQYSLSKHLMLVVGICYFLPMLAAMWVLRNVISMKNGKLSEVYWSQVRRWFLIEQNILFGQITSGIIFLFIA